MLLRNSRLHSSEMNLNLLQVEREMIRIIANVIYLFWTRHGFIDLTRLYFIWIILNIWTKCLMCFNEAQRCDKHLPNWADVEPVNAFMCITTFDFKSLLPLVFLLSWASCKRAYKYIPDLSQNIHKS